MYKCVRTEGKLICANVGDDSIAPSWQFQRSGVAVDVDGGYLLVPGGGGSGSGYSKGDGFVRKCSAEGAPACRVVVATNITLSDIAVDGAGKYLIADGQGQSILRCSNDGSCSSTSLDVEPNGPRSVADGGNGSVLVTGEFNLIKGASIWRCILETPSRCEKLPLAPQDQIQSDITGFGRRGTDAIVLQAPITLGDSSPLETFIDVCDLTDLGKSCQRSYLGQDFVMTRVRSGYGRSGFAVTQAEVFIMSESVISSSQDEGHFEFRTCPWVVGAFPWKLEDCATLEVVGLDGQRILREISINDVSLAATCPEAPATTALATQVDVVQALV